MPASQETKMALDIILSVIKIKVQFEVHILNYYLTLQVFYRIWTMWALALLMQMGPHKDSLMHPQQRNPGIHVYEKVCYN